MMQIKKLKFNQTSKEIGTITEERKTENKAMPLGFYLLFNSIWNTSARISLLSWDESRKKKKEIRKKYGQFNLNTEQLLGKCEEEKKDEKYKRWHNTMLVKVGMDEARWRSPARNDDEYDNWNFSFHNILSFLSLCWKLLQCTKQLTLSCKVYLYGNEKNHMASYTLPSVVVSVTDKFCKCEQYTVEGKDKTRIYYAWPKSGLWFCLAKMKWSHKQQWTCVTWNPLCVIFRMITIWHWCNELCKSAKLYNSSVHKENEKISLRDEKIFAHMNY